MWPCYEYSLGIGAHLKRAVLNRRREPHYGKREREYFTYKGVKNKERVLRV
jgi:hypothetical protein